MTRQEWLEWRIFNQLDPPTERRMTWLVASIVKAIWDVNRDQKKHPRPFKLDEFIVMMGDELPAGPTRNQTPAEKQRILMAFAMAYAPQAPKARRS